MPDAPPVSVQLAGSTATVWFEQPLVSVRFVRALGEALDSLEDGASGVKAVVFRGRGPDFLRGADLSEFHPGGPLDIHGFHKWEKLVRRIERLPFATVAAVDGRAEAAGAQLLLACDARVGTPGATLSWPEVTQGFLPGMAAFRLARFVGLGVARRLLLTGEVLDAPTAARLGLLDAVDAPLDAAASAAVSRFGPAHGVALSLARRLLDESYANEWEAAIGHFLAAQQRAITQPAFVASLGRRAPGAE